MKIQNILLLGSLFALAACDESKTLADGKEYPCVGAFAESEREPNVRYKASTNNIIVGIVFVETVFVPAVVALEETYCPVGFKTDTATHRDTTHK